jgi:hypothetical protein
MVVRLPTISGLERATACEGSNVYAQVAEPPGSDAVLGNDKHAFVYRAREAGRDEALAEIPLDAEHRAFCEALPLDKLPQGGRLEVAFAYNPETGAARVLGQNIGRAYAQHGLHEGVEIAGTADLEGVAGDVVHIIDWKTGHKHLGDPKAAWQLRALALAACRARGLDRARIAFWYLREDGTFHEDAAELNAFDLEDTADRLLEFVRSIRAATERWAAGVGPRASLGPWCDRCTSIPHCSAQVTLARSIARFEEPGPLTVDAAARAWAILDAYDLVAERARRALRDFAKLQPIPVAGGKEIRAVAWTTTKLDTTIAHAVIKDRFGENVAETAVKREVTISSVEDAISGIARAQGLKLAPLKRELLEEIEQRRGLSRLTTQQVRAMAVPKEKKPRKVTLKLEGKADDMKPVVEVEQEAPAA